MPSDNLTPSEYSMMILLMAEGRDISNTELQERFRTTLTGKSRTKLNGLGFVDSWRVGNTYWHRLAEAGWARCKEPIAVESRAALAVGAALTSLFAAVQRDLDRTGRSPAMMFAPTPTAGHAPGPTAGVEVAAPADLQEQIRLAYKQFAAGPGDWVNIADIREALPGVGREEMDAALRELEQQRDVNITPQADENSLSERTRRAAVIIGRQNKHFIAIGV